MPILYVAIIERAKSGNSSTTLSKADKRARITPHIGNTQRDKSPIPGLVVVQAPHDTKAMRHREIARKRRRGDNAKT
jgi:hypothetical protein